MNIRRMTPPVLAVWLLRRLYPERNRDIIIGDLLERFGKGRHSSSWFWRETLIAILLGTRSRLRLHPTEICFAAVGTAVICYPWELIFPRLLFLVGAFMSSGRRLDWPLNAPFLAYGMRSGVWIFYTFAVSAMIAALMVLPLFLVFMSRWKTFGAANLLRAFSFCALLFTVGDLPSVWWNLTHPPMTNGPWRSPAIWAPVVHHVWTFVALIISARLARQLPGESKATST